MDEELVENPDRTQLTNATGLAPQPDDIRSIVRGVGRFGVAVGAARLFLGANDLWFYVAFSDEHPTVRVVVGSLVALLMIMLAAGVIVASFACLQRRKWGPTLLMLNEQMAIALISLSGAAALAALYLERGSDGTPATDLQAAGDTLAWLVIELAYPVLALTIVRRRAVRLWLRDDTND